MIFHIYTDMADLCHSGIIFIYYFGYVFIARICYTIEKSQGGMIMNKHISTRRLVFTALMAALTVAGSWLRIKVPLDISGFSAFHLGNVMCALSGILLGPWLGGAAAGLGSAIYDMLDPVYISECWLTFLMKGAYGVLAGLVAWQGRSPWTADQKSSYLKALLASVTSALTYAALYLAKSYFYSGRLLSGLSHEAALLNVVAKLTPTAFNAGIAIVCAPPLAVAISKALEKSHLRLQ